MFSTSKKEVYELLASLGELTIRDDFIQIKNYPFEPSIVYNQSLLLIRLMMLI